MAENSAADCIFCKIVAGTIPAARIYEDTNVLVFTNLQQKNPGHSLIIPKAHYRNIYDITEDEITNVARVSVRVANAIKAAFNPAGLNSLQNSEAPAMQSIFHYHLHLIPRYSGDDLLGIWNAPPASPEELQANAAKIARHLS